VVFFWLFGFNRNTRGTFRSQYSGDGVPWLFCLLFKINRNTSGTFRQQYSGDKF